MNQDLQDDFKGFIKEAVKLAHKLPKDMYVLLFTYKGVLDYTDLKVGSKMIKEDVVELYKIKAKNEDSIAKILRVIKLKSLETEIRL